MAISHNLSLREHDDVVSTEAPGRGRLARIALSLTVGLITAEAVLRIAVWAMLGAPPWNPAAAIEHWYPELRATRVTLPPECDRRLLVLGGSVVDPAFSPLPGALADQLPGWQVCSIARASHTSRDSLLKYEALEDQRFDAVIWHHAINDSRANLVPAADFRADYSHMTWYAEAAAWSRHRRAPTCTVAPLVFALTSCRWSAALDNVVPEWRRLPTPEEVPEGAQLKTPAAYRANLERALQLARERGERVVIVTMPHRLFDAVKPGGTQPDVWGNPEHTAKAVAAHNAIARELAAQHAHASLVDMAELMPQDGRLFLDACHLTPQGCALWAWSVAPAVMR